MSGYRCGRRRAAPSIAIALVTGVLLLATCSTEEDSSPDPGTLQLVIAPTAIDLVQGESGRVTVTIERGGAFTGAVTLSASDSPAGVGVTFSNSLIAAGSTTATLTVAVDAAVAAGMKTVVIRAMSDNSALTAPATATLTVVVSAPAGSVRLAADPAILAAAAGGTDVTSSVALTRTAPFAGPVDLTLTGAPAGVTATISPGIAAGATAILSVSAAPEVRNGTYALMVRGTGTGIADAVTSVMLTVTGGTPRHFALTLDPPSLAIIAGGAGATSVVSLTPRFSRSIALYTSGEPMGLSVTLGTPMLRDNTTVTVRANTTVAAGTYVIRLMGEYNGVPWASAAIAVEVTAGSARRP